MKPFILFTLALICSVASAQPSADMGKTLVVYYSFTGNVSTIVSQLTQQISADIAEVKPAEEGLDYANEVDRLSVEREPGVVCLFPMQTAADSCQIRILEIYASDEAYQSHLKTDHFQRYKQGTAHMVKSLSLPAMQPLDPAMMPHIFRKQPLSD